MRLAASSLNQEAKNARKSFSECPISLKSSEHTPEGKMKSPEIERLLLGIKSLDPAVRGPAWQGAGPIGAPAVKPLVALLTDADFEISRSAKRALYQIVRHAGRPHAPVEAKAVEVELIPLLRSDSVLVRREVLWLLSEIGGDAAVAPVAELLADKEVREEARCALTRVPGQKATAALKAALGSTPEEFRFALAESLRLRGEKVDGYPSRKLEPQSAANP